MTRGPCGRCGKRLDCRRPVVPRGSAVPCRSIPPVVARPRRTRARLAQAGLLALLAVLPPGAPARAQAAASSVARPSAAATGAFPAAPPQAVPAAPRPGAVDLGPQAPPPGPPASPDELAEFAALRAQLQELTGRVDELSRQLLDQERSLGALAVRAPLPDARGEGLPAQAAPVAAASAPVLARPPAPAVESSLPALIVMVGGDGGVTLQGRPVVLPTLGFALRAAAAGDASRRIVIGAEPGVDAARVGAVVGTVSQAGFGRITITGP